MKKYLFDEILIDSNGKIKFKSFRDISYLEIFSTCKCGSAETDKSYANRDRWFFEPKTLKQFLNCLEITKPTTKGEIELNFMHPFQDFTFDDVLNLFVNRTFETKKVSEDKVVAFYKKAKEITKENRLEREILEQKPSELIK